MEYKIALNFYLTLFLLLEDKFFKCNVLLALIICVPNKNEQSLDNIYTSLVWIQKAKTEIVRANVSLNLSDFLF